MTSATHFPVSTPPFSPPVACSVVAGTPICSRCDAAGLSICEIGEPDERVSLGVSGCRGSSQTNVEASHEGFQGWEVSWRDEFEDAFVLREEAGAGGRVSEEAIKARRSGG